MNPKYKLVSYRAANQPRAGIVVDELVFDVAALTGLSSYTTTLDLLDDWEEAQPILESAAGRAKEHRADGMPLAATKLLAPVLYPPAIYCAGANYADHFDEMAAVRKIEPGPDPRSQEQGQMPWHFIKASRTVIETQTTISLPAHSKTVDWEGELAAVIGKEAKNLSANGALGVVAGYTIGVDLSARDFMSRPNLPAGSPFRFDWLSQKSFDGACPLGPWIVPAKELPDPQNLGIKLWVNDVLKQDSNTRKMIFTLAEQIEYLSSRITLHPGDVILTGTPAGVGAARGEFLKPGDVLRVWVEGVGTLTDTLA
jgi:2-keto-4-pentenoate hydratase/2-oxohepta-3-ene-1,7-dioic acid hydratase in catechol pathway